MNLLQEYCLVALDVFRKKTYSEDRSEQTAWLSLLITETIEDAEKLITEYPWPEDIYKEIAMLRQRPEEVLHMFSEALKIMDRNTVHYMIEEQQKELEEQQRLLSVKDQEIHAKNKTIQAMNKKLDIQQQEIEALKKELAALQAQKI